MSVPLVGAVVIVPEVMATEENAPVDGVVAPTEVALIVPPVIATALAFCVDIVPKPETCVLVIAIAVSAMAVN